MSKTVKALVAVLALATVSIAAAANASAAPYGGEGWYQGFSSAGYMSPRHDPTNTNGW